MANTSPVFVRVDANVKAKSEAILNQLGVSLSSAVNMFLTQIIIHNGLPFDVRLFEPPTCIGNMTEEEIKAEIQKGIDSLENDRTFTPEEVDEMLKNI